ncbi:MAG: hypothetical protein A2Y61_07910 [Chloroflexi bacterium RBG_13_60_13]|nr:MAG: hypothetical protein A2Y61_07910 [Chloroflexi bacterium RBG_13_60_13]
MLPPDSSGGSIILQDSDALEQRGWNRQPEGGLAGLGTSPGRIRRARFVNGSGIGVESTSAWV